MNEQSTNSINFVISAAYTFTFANSLFFMLLADAEKPVSLENIDLTASKTAAGLICLTMSLRFFFGNNNYIYAVMIDPSRGPWQKFYQFWFIALQSVILLFASYVINQPRVFVATIILLFVVETVWYIMTFVVDPEGVKNNEGDLDMPFLRAQVTNFLFWAFSVLLYCNLRESADALMLGVLMIFALNTAYDAWKNMPGYMGTA